MVSRNRIKIYESKYRYFEEKEFQSWSDLTGEDYYIKDKLYEPHAKLRSKAILRTRNFLCKNLKKKETISLTKIEYIYFFFHFFFLS